MPPGNRLHCPAGQIGGECRHMPAGVVACIGSSLLHGGPRWAVRVALAGRVAALVTALFPAFTWALPPGSIKRRAGRYCGAPARPYLAAAPSVRTGGRR
jgi:hypothetical protein